MRQPTAEHLHKAHLKVQIGFDEPIECHLQHEDAGFLRGLANKVLGLHRRNAKATEKPFAVLQEIYEEPKE